MGSCGGRFGQEEDHKEDKEENNTQEVESMSGYLPS